MVGRYPAAGGADRLSRPSFYSAGGVEREVGMESMERKVALAGSERRPLPGAEVLGAADVEQRITVTIYIRRNPEAPLVPSVEEFSMTPPTQRAYFSDEQIEALRG